jgi:hypothetical protein
MGSGLGINGFEDGRRFRRVGKNEDRETTIEFLLSAWQTPIVLIVFLVKLQTRKAANHRPTLFRGTQPKVTTNFRFVLSLFCLADRL